MSSLDRRLDYKFAHISAATFPERPDEEAARPAILTEQWFRVDGREWKA
jgi:hypothetical protein